MSGRDNDGGGSDQFRLNAGEHCNDSLNINNDQISDLDFLKRDDIGGDYIRFGQEFMHFDSFIDSSTAKQYFNTDGQHLYLGRKSMRLELKKMYDWVHLVGDKLMNLRLVSWRGIGYKTWANHHPALWYDPLSRYVDTTFIVSNKLYLQNISDPDSVGRHPFYDITMHKIIDTAFDTRFMLGIQNRRTDPLLYEPGYFNNAMKFVPTAEFDEYVHNGGLNIPASDWQNFWWHRLGCREIQLRFKKPNEYANYKVTYRIKEIAKGTSLDTNWWRDPKYMHVPDTTLVIWPREKEAIFSARMLPGEGKMLEVIPTFENIADKCMECDQIKDNFRAKITKDQFTWGDAKLPFYSVMISNINQCYYESLKLRLYYKPFLPKVGIITSPNLTFIDDTTKGYLDLTYSQPKLGDTTGLLIFYPMDIVTKLELKVLNRFGEECPTPLDTFSQVFPPLCRDYVELRFKEGDCNSNYTDAIFATYNPNYPKVTLKIVKTEGNGEPDTLNRVYPGSFIDTMYTGSFRNSRGTYTVYIFDNGKYVCEESFSISRNSCPAKIKIETKDNNIKLPPGQVALYCKMKVKITADSNICNQRYEIKATNFKTISGNLTTGNRVVEHEIAYGPGEKVYTINVYGEDGVTICETKKINLCCIDCPRRINLQQQEQDFKKYILSLIFERIDDPGIICTHVGIINNQPEADDNPIYGAVIYNTDNPVDKYYEVYKDPKTDNPIDVTSGNELTNICQSELLPLRFTLALLDKDMNIVTETAFDSTFVQTGNQENLTVLSVTGEPNPTSGGYSLSYSLSRNAVTTILITDRFGVPVLTTDLGEMSAGLHRQNFDFNSLPNGTYYGIVRANGEAKSILFAIYK